jgi:hypothetical protein
MLSPSCVHDVCIVPWAQNNRAQQPWAEVSETIAKINLSSFEVNYLGYFVTVTES